MKKLSFIKSALFVALALTSSLHAAEHEVKMLNSGSEGSMVFEPGFLQVEVGDTVKFVATDGGHNSASTYVPEGAKSWAGDIGEEVTVTIDKEGLYVYVCDPHKMLAMAGVIQAGKATNKEAALKASKELSSAFALNKDRLDKYLEQVK